MIILNLFLMYACISIGVLNKSSSSCCNHCMLLRINHWTRNLMLFTAMSLWVYSLELVTHKFQTRSAYSNSISDISICNDLFSRIFLPSWPHWLIKSYPPVPPSKFHRSRKNQIQLYNNHCTSNLDMSLKPISKRVGYVKTLSAQKKI